MTLIQNIPGGLVAASKKSPQSGCVDPPEGFFDVHSNDYCQLPAFLVLKAMESRYITHGRCDDADIIDGHRHIAVVIADMTRGIFSAFAHGIPALRRLTSGFSDTTQSNSSSTDRAMLG